MSFERAPSFLLSLCLHLGIFALALFWPSPGMAPLDINRAPMISGLVTIGKAGKAVPDAGKSTPQAQRGQQDTQPEPVRKPRPEQPDAKKVAQVETPEPPKKAPDVKPVEKPVEKPLEKPVVAPDAVPIPKEPDKKKPPEPAPTKNATKPADPKAKPGPATKPKDDLAGALASLDKQVGERKGKGRSGAATGRGNGQSLSHGLEELRKQVGGAGGDAAGDGPGGSGGDGMGVLGAYEHSIISRVRPNWAWPGRTDRATFTAVVNIQIGPDGSIQNARLISPSGNGFFDSSVMQAVAATQNLEAPPKGVTDVNISFTPEGLATQ